MSKNYKFKERILEETKTEMLLKAFLTKMNMFMGEEIAVSTLALRSDMIDSLNEYTSKFEKWLFYTKIFWLYSEKKNIRNNKI